MDDIIKLLMRLPLNQLDGVVRLELSEGQVLLIDGYTGEVSDQASHPEDVTLKLSQEDLVGILTGKEHVISLFTAGKIVVEGDMGLAFRLKEILG